MARLVFLGRLEDLAGAAEIVLPLEEGASLDAAVSQLPGDLAAALRSPTIRIAVNGELLPSEAQFDATITDADEIAFLPPVSGG